MQHYKVTRLTLTIDESSADVAEHARQQKVKAKVTLCAETARLQCKQAVRVATQYGPALPPVAHLRGANPPEQYTHPALPFPSPFPSLPFLFPHPILPLPLPFSSPPP